MMSDQHHKILIRTEVYDVIKSLDTATDALNIKQKLQHLFILLPTQDTPENSWLPEALLPKAREEFQHFHYAHFLSVLSDHFCVDWSRKLSKKEWTDYVDVFFLDGWPLNSFMYLCHALPQSKPSFKQDKCVFLLTELIHRHKFEEIIWQQCFVPKGHAEDVKRQTEWEGAITLIISLPDRVANKLQKRLGPRLLPQPYFTILARDILNVLIKVQQNLQDGESLSITFLGLLIGRICQSGHTDTLLDVILPSLVELSDDSLIWQRICEQLFLHVPDRCLEKLVVGVLKKTPWFGFLGNMLGDAVTKSNTLQTLLTKKLLLMRHYPEDLFLQNIFGYLAGSEKRRKLLPKILKSLLETWSDGSSVKHTSYDQHLYISKAVVIAIGHLNQTEICKNKDDYLKFLMDGMKHHLQSPIPNMRQLGMMLAETLTKQLDSSGHHSLKFEYEENAETEAFKSLLHPPKKPSKEDTQKFLPKLKEVVQSDFGSKKRDTEVLPTTHTAEEEELDSDDDLEPYDMSCDTPVKSVKTPVYIRDCMAGLISNDKPDLFEASLEVAANLVTIAPDFKEVCVEYMKILLSVEDRFSTTNFAQLRHSAIVAAAVRAPQLAAGVLTQEFYDRNYNIKQRLDMLEVLADASQQLSKPLSGEKKSQLDKPTQVAMETDKGLVKAEHWKDIVQRRIDSKTRRFGKGPRKPAMKPTENRFAEFAGHFFFPLIRHYDNSMNTMDMLGDDFLLLGRLLFTLGIIVASAENAPVLRQMAKSMLELIWVLRYHTEPFVRRGLLFSLSMVLLTVPSFILVSEMQDELMECRYWLQDILCKDTDVESCKLAAKAGELLDYNMQKELVHDHSSEG
ncbi:telomere length regulation protein TEL2 homolog [Anneissia japonica]|uniref:telomere length regulation protein TEL2 homolog n=1 Tax=Anneissia japonica TaxID=1529436 RepID=UPI0014258C39|nr:telomere length regulation protein TEL2 homolog [Anneissia japonica]XP_033117770.1 telomere length regulation protein TEL2 homolog [Anneissia japonica]XP_033117771.1 telomere length regulation protein TEL2 homolog [Anneissia japonica]